MDFIIGVFGGILFNYILRVINNNVITSIAFAVLIVASGIYDVIQIKGFINKTFECLVCGQNFKPKWYKLWLQRWRTPKKYRTYKELNTGTFEKLIYKCPKCKNRECIAKD